MGTTEVSCKIARYIIGFVDPYHFHNIICYDNIAKFTIGRMRVNIRVCT